MTWLLFGLGLFLMIGGLAHALAPSRICKALVAQASDRVPRIGRAMMAVGVLDLWPVRPVTS